MLCVLYKYTDSLFMEHCLESLTLDEEYDDHKCRHSNDQDDGE